MTKKPFVTLMAAAVLATASTAAVADEVSPSDGTGVPSTEQTAPVPVTPSTDISAPDASAPAETPDDSSDQAQSEVPSQSEEVPSTPASSTDDSAPAEPESSVPSDSVTVPAGESQNQAPSNQTSSGTVGVTNQNQIPNVQTDIEEMKTLPKTGDAASTSVSLFGLVLTFISGLYWKRTHKKTRDV